MTFRLTTEENRGIPVQLSKSEFNEFILMHLLEKMQKRYFRVSCHKMLLLLAYLVPLRPSVKERVTSRHFKIVNLM